MSQVFLAVPTRWQRRKTWRRIVREHLINRQGVAAFVFHSNHAKVWARGSSLALPKSRVIKVEDQTKHFDFELLLLAYQAMALAADGDYGHGRAADILTHYLFNMAGCDYSDEVDFFKESAKRRVALAQDVTAESDHG